MLKNLINCQTTNHSLVEFYLNVIDKNDKSDSLFIQNLMYLFEEIKFFTNEQTQHNTYIRSVIDRVLTEQPKPYNNQDELQLPRKHFMIGLLMIYWQLEIQSPDMTYFKLLKLVIAKESDIFCNLYGEEMIKIAIGIPHVYKLHNKYNTRHQQTDTTNIFHYYEKYLTNFSFVLLYAALVTDQKQILNTIFKFENFLISDPTFPHNMQISTIHNDCVLAFMEHKYELGRDNLPRAWITKDVLLLFLNSKIETDCNNICKIDSNFLNPYYNQHQQQQCNTNIDKDDLLFNEDTDTLLYIIKSPALEPLIWHPVIETTIRLKLQKYSRLFALDFYGFIFLHIFSSVAFGCFFHFQSAPFVKGYNQLQTLDMFVIYVFVYTILTTRLVLCGAREYLRYIINRQTYFNQRLTLVDIGLFLCPCVLLVSTILYMFMPITTTYILLVFLEVVNAILIICASSKQFQPICQSRDKQLLNLTKKYIKISSQIRVFHAINEQIENKCIRDKLMYTLLRFALGKYNLIHRLQTIYINLNTRSVYVPNNGNFFDIIEQPFKLYF